MKISVTQAKARLTDLVRRAEAGEEVTLTRHGSAAVRLVPVEAAPVKSLAERHAALEKIIASAAGKASPGPCAARSQDWLYDENGLPA